MNNMSNDLTYNQRGVSATKEDVYTAIKNLNKGLFPNAFCKILPDLFGKDNEYCNIVHADGSGTKSALAYLYWKETNDISVWRGVAQDAIVMNTDDLLCVGAINDFVFCSIINRNKGLIPAEVLSEIINGTQQFFNLMHTLGVSIHYGGGETADLGDLIRTVTVDSTISCRLKQSDVITANIQAGDVIVGFSSYGQATYEHVYNSGIGSNGLTAARHDVLSNHYAKSLPETYDPGIAEQLIYSGKLNITDNFEGAPLNVGQLLLSPTRTYLPVMHKIIPAYRNQIHAIIHCSGGGQKKVLHYLDKSLRIVKNNLLTVPHVFKMIQEQSNTTWEEMYQVFNMGHRLEIYTNPETAKGLISMANSFNIEAKVIGYVEPADTPALTLDTSYGLFHFKK